MPDLYTIGGVLLELAGYDALPVTLTVAQDGQEIDLEGSPVELMTQLEEFSGNAQITSFQFSVLSDG